jgi:hypothetical protein
MSSALDNLLDSIHPSRTLDEVSSRVDMAVNSFQVKSGLVENWDEYKDIFAKFYCHLENSILNLRTPRPLNLDFDWSRCNLLLNKEFGNSGEKTAFEIIRTGVEGGLFSVLRSVARQMAEEYAGREISARITNFWEGLSLDEQLAVSEEYLEKYGHLLPSELTEGSAARIRANFLKVLEEHPRMIQKLRNAGPR